MLVFRFGRGVTANDRRNVAEMLKAWEAKDYRLESLIYIVAHSLPFQSRREESIDDENRVNSPTENASQKAIPGNVPSDH